MTVEEKKVMSQAMYEDMCKFIEKYNLSEVVYVCVMPKENDKDDIVLAQDVKPGAKRRLDSLVDSINAALTESQKISKGERN